jgi:hypothetical protein
MDIGVIVIVISIFFVAPIGPVTFLIVRYNRKTKKSKEEISAFLGAAWSGNTISGTHQETPFECYFFPGKKNDSTKYLDIKLFFPCPVEIEIRKEGVGDRMAKKIGLSVEAQTNDPEFDSNYYIDCDNNPFAKQFLSNIETRRIIEELLSIKNAKNVFCGPEYLKLHISPCEPSSPTIDGQIIKAAIDNLGKLRKADMSYHPPLEEQIHLPAGYGQPHSKSSTATSTLVYKHASKILPGIGVAALVAGTTLNTFAVSPINGGLFSGQVKATMMLALPLIAVFLFIAFRILKGRASSGRHFLYAMVFAIPGFIMLCYSGIVFTNHFFDTGSESKYVVSVQGKHTSTSNDSTNYYLEITDWRDKNDTRNFSVGDYLYSNTEKGDELAIYTMPGKWGYEWVSDYEKVEPIKK